MAFISRTEGERQLMVPIKYCISRLQAGLSFQDTKYTLIQNIKSQISCPDVEQFCIGKTFICQSGQSEKGIKSRWDGKYRDEGYDVMVVIAVISAEILPDHRQSKEYTEQYTLSLEQELINYFMWSENERRLANTTTDPGRKSTENKEAYALYIAIKYLTTSIVRTATNLAIVEVQSVKALATLIADSCKYTTSEELKQKLIQRTVMDLQLSRISPGICTSFINSTLHSLLERATFFSASKVTNESAAETSQIEEIVDKFITAEMSAVKTICIAQLQGSEYHQKCCLVHEEAQRVVSEGFRQQMTSMDNYKKLEQELSYQYKFVFSIAEYISNSMKLE